MTTLCVARCTNMPFAIFMAVDVLIYSIAIRASILSPCMPNDVEKKD